jgi:hypothetical protein
MSCALSRRLLLKSHRKPRCSLPPSTPSKSPDSKRRPTSLMEQNTRRSYVMCFSLPNSPNLTEFRVCSLPLPLPYPPNPKTPKYDTVSYCVPNSSSSKRMILHLNIHDITTQIDRQKIHDRRPALELFDIIATFVRVSNYIT